MRAFITFMMLFASSELLGKVYLYGQWHLGAKAVTLDINKSKGLPQYKNQTWIYNELYKQIEQGKIKTLIAEGCEGEINQSFRPIFNGWSFEKLYELRRTKEYSHIISHIPLKLEAYFGKKLMTYCGDNLSLMERNALAFSEAKGNLGFYARLKQYRNNPKRYKLYEKAFFGKEGAKGRDALPLTKELAIKAVDDIEESLKLRNAFFVKAIEKFKGEHVAVVIGAAHLEDLKKRLKKSGFSYVVVKTLGLPSKENSKVSDLRSAVLSL